MTTPSLAPRASAPRRYSALHPAVWPAHALATAPLSVVPTGDAQLDAELPGGGWPVGALVEILQMPGVHHEWRLLLPALVRSGWGAVALVGAPHVPFSPSLAAQGLQTSRLLRIQAPDAQARLWAVEQVLRCAEVDAVLAWLPQVRSAPLRRLQMAAAGHGKLLFVMRPHSVRNEASAATLRLQVEPVGAASALGEKGQRAARADALAVHIVKRRGPPLERAVILAARSTGLEVLLAACADHVLDCPA